jgi:hypothetical protein
MLQFLCSRWGVQLRALGCGEAAAGCSSWIGCGLWSCGAPGSFNQQPCLVCAGLLYVTQYAGARCKGVQATLAQTLAPHPTPSHSIHPHPMLLCPQGVYGAVTSVAQGPDGTMWVLTRGGRVWDGNTFDDTTHVMVDRSLIPVPVVHQLHPETGEEQQGGCRRQLVSGLQWQSRGVCQSTTPSRPPHTCSSGVSVMVTGIPVQMWRGGVLRGAIWCCIRAFPPTTHWCPCGC